MILLQEFDGSSWEGQAVSAAEDAQLWQDDWEGDDVNDDFTQQLRAQIQARTENNNNGNQQQ